MTFLSRALREWHLLGGTLDSRFAGLVIAIVVVCDLGSGDALAQTAGAKAHPAPIVFVDTIKKVDVRDQVEFSGRVEAIKKIELVARVTGFLTRRLFEEGSVVKKGDLLFEIEPASYEIAVASSEADVMAAKAVEREAQDNFDRVATLQKTGTSTLVSLEGAQSRLTQAKAATSAKMAALRQAKLDLSYTKIFANVDGRIGRVSHAVGDLINPSSAPLATVVFQDPMYVAFPVPQSELTKFHTDASNASAFDVEVRLANGAAYPHRGVFAFVDTEFVTGTDTVVVRAKIPNPDAQLIDQQLVDVVVVDSKPQKVLLVSQSALVLDQQGSHVFVVDEKGKVEVKRVKLGKQYGARIAVLSGLKSGDRVIVGGHHRARPGLVVSARTRVLSAKKPGAKKSN